MASFRDSVDDIERITKAAECAICKDEGADRLLPTCYHSLCRNCAVTLKSGKTIKCPICHQTNKIPKGDVDKLATNFTALKVIDEATRVKERRIQEKPKNLGMQLIVKGVDGTTQAIQLQSSDDTVEKLKAVVHKQTGVAKEEQRLLYLGKELESGKKLSFYKLKSNQTIHMVHRMVGGQFCVLFILRNCFCG